MNINKHSRKVVCLFRPDRIRNATDFKHMIVWWRCRLSMCQRLICERIFLSVRKNWEEKNLRDIKRHYIVFISYRESFIECERKKMQCTLKIHREFRNRIIMPYIQKNIQENTGGCRNFYFDFVSKFSNTFDCVWPISSSTKFSDDFTSDYFRLFLTILRTRENFL
jgi:hypothetical protein